jgi:hypothetical protein
MEGRYKEELGEERYCLNTLSSAYKEYKDRSSR